METTKGTEDNIERYLKELEAIKNYDKVKKERDEALRKASPVALLQQIISQLNKPRNERIFPLDVQSRMIEEIERLIKEQVEKNIDFEIWYDRISRSSSSTTAGSSSS